MGFDEWYGIANSNDEIYWAYSRIYEVGEYAE